MLFETERGMVKAVGERDLPPRAARRSRRGQTSECGCGRRSDRGCFESPVAPPGVSAQAARSHRDRQPLAERRQIRSERRFRPTEPPTSRDNRSERREAQHPPPVVVDQPANTVIAKPTLTVKKQYWRRGFNGEIGRRAFVFSKVHGAWLRPRLVVWRSDLWKSVSGSY